MILPQTLLYKHIVHSVPCRDKHLLDPCPLLAVEFQQVCLTLCVGSILFFLSLATSLQKQSLLSQALAHAKDSQSSEDLVMNDDFPKENHIDIETFLVLAVEQLVRS